MHGERVVLASHDGLQLVGDAYGDPTARPVLLLHGGGQTRNAWGGTAAALAAAGLHAVALDMRGHGESDWASDGNYRLVAYAADLAAIVGRFERPVAVVGASLGGLAALLAEGEAEGPLLAALVLVDIAPRLEMKGVSRIIGFMTAHPDGFASLDEAADAVAGFLHHRPRPGDTAGLAKNLRQGADGRYRWHWDPRFIRGDYGIDANTFQRRLSACAQHLDVPTLLVRGRQSDVLSEEAAKEFLELAPHAEYVDVAHAAHMVAGDRNDAFTDAVVGFLGRVGDGG